MGVFDELEAAVKPRVHVCKVGRFLATLDKKDAADLKTVFEELQYPIEVIKRVMHGRGFDGSSAVVNRHARKQCGCHVH